MFIRVTDTDSNFHIVNTDHIIEIGEKKRHQQDDCPKRFIVTTEQPGGVSNNYIWTDIPLGSILKHRV